MHYNYFYCLYIIITIMSSYISTLHIYAFSFKQVLASLAHIENKDESADYHSDIDT